MSWPTAKLDSKASFVLCHEGFLLPFLQPQHGIISTLWKQGHRDQQVAHGNQNKHAQAQDPEGGFPQVELYDFLDYGGSRGLLGRKTKQATWARSVGGWEMHFLDNPSRTLLLKW